MDDRHQTLLCNALHDCADAQSRSVLAGRGVASVRVSEVWAARDQVVPTGRAGRQTGPAMSCCRAVGSGAQEAQRPRMAWRWRTPPHNQQPRAGMVRRRKMHSAACTARGCSSHEMQVIRPTLPW